MPYHPFFTLQNAKATSWLNAFKGNKAINEKFPSSFNITVHSISKTDSFTNRPENYFCHAAFIDLALGQEQRKSNPLHGTLFPIYGLLELQQCS